MLEGNQAERYVLNELWSANYHEKIINNVISLIFRQDFLRKLY